jgi:hypothetical protein
VNLLEERRCKNLLEDKQGKAGDVHFNVFDEKSPGRYYTFHAKISNFPNA